MAWRDHMTPPEREEVAELDATMAKGRIAAKRLHLIRRRAWKREHKATNNIA